MPIPSNSVRLDYEKMVALMRSETREDAAFVLTQQARGTEFGDDAAAAFSRALNLTADHGRAPRAATEHVLRDAFWRLEQLGRRRPSPSLSLFMERVNECASMTVMMKKAKSAGEMVIAAKGASAVSSSLVQGHVREILSIVGNMGTRYLETPDAWADFIENAYKDLTQLAFFAFGAEPAQLLQKMQRLIMICTRDMPDDVRRELEERAHLMNTAFIAKDFGGCRERALETWVLMIEGLGLFAPYRDSIGVESVRSFEVREVAAPRFNDPAASGLTGVAADLADYASSVDGADLSAASELGACIMCDAVAPGIGVAILQTAPIPLHIVG